MTNTKNSGGGSRAVPLSERQQLAMIMRMSDESTQGKLNQELHVFVVVFTGKYKLRL